MLLQIRTYPIDIKQEIIYQSYSINQKGRKDNPQKVNSSEDKNQESNQLKIPDQMPDKQEAVIRVVSKLTKKDPLN